MLRAGIAATFLSLVACGAGATETPAHWVRTHSIAFQRVSAETPLDDLQGLDALIGDARIVALGEPTHGSREVFQMKHRLVEYLAKKKGFTIFAIEANMPEANRLDGYVLGGDSDPRKLISGMYFWTWHTEEVLAMVEWMRRFNAAGGGPIHFTGFDMQTPDVAMDSVKAFVQRSDPQYADTLQARYATVQAPSPGSVPSHVPSTEGAVAVVRHLAAARDTYLQHAPAATVDWAIQDARIVEQASEHGRTHRDSCMACNIAWILAQNPKAKIVLWAHNGHVGRGAGAMGRFLETMLPKQMLVLGFTTSNGRYTAVERGLGAHDLSAPPAGSLESLLATVGRPRMIVDLRRATPKTPAWSWFAESRPMRSIGAVATTEQFSPAVARDLYDGIVYLDTTSEALQLPGVAGANRKE